MAVNSRQKGARFEREIARRLREYGFEARRGQQFSGSPDSPDVVSNLPGVHIECKAVEHLNLYDAMEQSKRDAGEGETPIVVHKKNRKPILVTLAFEDYMDLIIRSEKGEN